MLPISHSTPWPCKPPEIDVWLTEYRHAALRPHLAELLELLSDSEREQRNRFIFEDDRLRYLVTRATVRLVLSSYVPVRPVDWTFEKNRYGRPYIARRHDVPELNFSISHTSGMLGIAVCRTRMLGLDVECLSARQPALDIAHHFFSAAEAAELTRLPEQDKVTRFFEYWTLKESYIKARGMGLSLPLDRFSFDFREPAAIRVAFDDASDDPLRWHFRLCTPRPDYVLALCAERRDDTHAAVSVRSFLPLGASTEVDIDWTRTSG
jgi:4'-phosphopantetheinyl transferase